MPLTARLSAAALAAVLITPVFAAPVQTPTPIHWSMKRPDAAALAAGKTFAVDVTAEIEAGWHLYALVEPPGPIPTAITIPKGGPFSIDGDIGTLPPKKAFDPGFGVETEFYEEHTTFTVPVRIASGTKGKLTLTIDAMFQTCNDRMCLPPTTQKVTLEVAIGG
jgi:thiol:disulfide interchange protein DsbD